jgi:hypothetical protein
MSRVKTNCQRLVATASARRGYVFSYQRPVRKTDLKREGKTLQVGIAGRQIILDGHGIRMLKTILRDCGEIGRKVNQKHTRVLSTLGR